MELDLLDLIPHADDMRLIEWVEEWGDDYVVAGSRTHLYNTNPLRSDGWLDPVQLCEYGAQAMALHGGLLARASGQTSIPGFLVSLRNIQLTGGDVSVLPGPLIISARRLNGDTRSWQYNFTVAHDHTTIASGRAAVMLGTL